MKNKKLSKCCKAEIIIFVEGWYDEVYIYKCSKCKKIIKTNRTKFFDTFKDLTRIRPL